MPATGSGTTLSDDDHAEVHDLKVRQPSEAGLDRTLGVPASLHGRAVIIGGVGKIINVLDKVVELAESRLLTTQALAPRRWAWSKSRSNFGASSGPPAGRFSGLLHTPYPPATPRIPTGWKIQIRESPDQAGILAAISKTGLARKIIDGLLAIRNHPDRVVNAHFLKAATRLASSAQSSTSKI